MVAAKIGYPRSHPASETETENRRNISVARKAASQVERRSGVGAAPAAPMAEQ
jgi:hypothetical protein